MATTYTPPANSNAALAWLQRHPLLYWVLSGIWRLFGYVFSLQWIVDFTRWLQLKGGLIAESAFTLATTYVILDLVAHPAVTWLMSDSMINGANQIALICFSVLPELIAVAAVLKTLELWGMFIRTKDKGLLFWPTAYTITTAIFVTMTLLTITGFSASIEAMNNGSTQVIYHLDGTSVVIRVITGFCFGTIELIHAKIGSAQFTRLFDTLRSQLVASQNVTTQRDTTITDLQNDIARLQQQMTNSIAQLQSDLAAKEQELIDARLALATRKMTRNKKETTAQPDEVHTDALPAIGISKEKRAKLKAALRKQITTDGKPNVKAAAVDAGMSYATARKYAQAIVAEITEELSPRLALVKEA